MPMKPLTIILISAFLCTASLAAETAPTAEQSIFSGSFADALWTVIAFVLLLAILTKVAWKPLLSGLKAREDHIREQIETAEHARSKAEKLIDDYKQQGLTIIKQSADHAQKHELEVIEKTRQEIDLIKQRAQDDIKHATAAASEQLWEQAGDITLKLSSEVLSRSITPEDNKRLIDEAIAKIKP